MESINKENIETIFNATTQIKRLFKFDFNIQETEMQFQIDSLIIVDEILNKAINKTGGVNKTGWYEKGGAPQIISLTAYIGAVIINSKKDITVIPENKKIDLFFLNENADINFKLSYRESIILPFNLIQNKIKYGHKYSIYTTVVNYLNID